MNNITKIKILKPASEVFEAFVDPCKIGKFWFSSSSERWEQGKLITLKYDEYAAQGDIKVVRIEENKTIIYQWGANGEGNIVTINLEEINNASTIVEIKEESFDEKDDEFLNNLLDNKEGWVYTLTCLKGYLEYGVSLRAALVK